MNERGQEDFCKKIKIYDFGNNKKIVCYFTVLNGKPKFWNFFFIENFGVGLYGIRASFLADTVRLDHQNCTQLVLFVQTLLWVKHEHG